MDVDGSLGFEPLNRRPDDRYVRRRRGIEDDHATQVFGQSRIGFNLENARVVHRLIAWALRATLLYGRGRRNAARVALVENRVRSSRLPRAFHGLRVLQLSDLHADMSREALARTTELVATLEVDLCVLTGDFRGPTTGPFEEAMAITRTLLARLDAPAYAVLGNHDSIDMVASLDAMGARCLLNETVALRRGGQSVYLVGVDDAHFYRTDNLDRALEPVPEGGFTILLSHTPELWRQAAHSDIDLMLSGHTHGGQICLPGGIPVMLSANLPRRLGRGAWRHHGLQGYTSVGCGSCVVPVRFNCPPEITLHVLEAAPAQ